VPSYGFEFLNNLFLPGKGPGRMPRTQNRLKRGYLKRSMFSGGWKSVNKPHQGKRECARRLRQIEMGIIRRG
jgi:hypothetical protein